MPIMLVLFFIAGSIQSADRSSLDMLAFLALQFSSEGAYPIQTVSSTHPESALDNQVEVIPKNFLCLDCGKVFKNLPHLNRHQITHTGVKSYPCRHCGKLFSRKDSRNRHENGTQRCIKKRSKTK
jgi:uncharacterized Zn-finger protein